MNCFITGVTGTLGQTVTGMLLARGHTVIGYSRDEQKQRTIPQYEGLTLYLGDIRDRTRMFEAARGADIIFHFAALKCVDTLEKNPEEAIATNVIGTENVLYAQRALGIDRVVLASTDKAVYPINAYGNSKALAERLVLRNPNNVVCRYGNVLGSRGSVLPMFVASLKSKEAHVEVTDKRMTRFWTTVDRAASFVIQSGFEQDGGLKIPPMQTASVVQLVDTVAEYLDVKAFSVNDVGIRPGEKIHECLIASHEALDGEAVFSDSHKMSEEQLRVLVGEAMRDLRYG